MHVFFKFADFQFVIDLACTVASAEEWAPDWIRLSFLGLILPVFNHL